MLFLQNLTERTCLLMIDLFSAHETMERKSFTLRVCFFTYTCKLFDLNKFELEDLLASNLKKFAVECW